MQDFAHRLRHLKKTNGWTTADMTLRSGLPKRSLEKYMLREGASQPGYEALIAMARGFGVSLDWLVFGTDQAGEYTTLLVKRCTFAAALTVFEALLNKAVEDGKPVTENGEILGHSLEYWADILSDQAVKEAQAIGEQAATKESLLTWKHAHSEQMQEIYSDWMARQLKIGNTGSKTKS